MTTVTLYGINVEADLEEVLKEIGTDDMIEVIKDRAAEGKMLEALDEDAITQHVRENSLLLPMLMALEPADREALLADLPPATGTGPEWLKAELLRLMTQFGKGAVAVAALSLAIKE